MEPRIKQMLGDMAFTILSLQIQLDQANQKILELTPKKED